MDCLQGWNSVTRSRDYWCTSGFLKGLIVDQERTVAGFSDESPNSAFERKQANDC